MILKHGSTKQTGAQVLGGTSGVVSRRKVGGWHDLIRSESEFLMSSLTDGLIRSPIHVLAALFDAEPCISRATDPLSNLSGWSKVVG